MRAAQFLVGGAQLFLASHSLRDVPENSLNADDVALRIVDGRLDDVDVALLAARGLVHLDGFKRLAAVQHMPVIGLILGREFGVEEIEVRPAHNLLQRLADQLAKFLIGEGEPLVKVLADDVLGQRLDQRMVEQLRLLQPLLRRLARRDVPDQSVIRHHVSLLVAARHHRVANPAHLVVLADQAVFDGRRLALADEARLLQHGRLILGMHHAQPQFRIGAVMLRRVASQRHAGRAVDCLHHHAVAQLHRVGVVGDRFQQVLVMPLALLQGLLDAMPLDGVM